VVGGRGGVRAHAQLYHSEAEECMYELVDFAEKSDHLPVTCIRFMQLGGGEVSKQYLLVTACKCALTA